jgi:chromosome partitioning protein
MLHSAARWLIEPSAFDYATNSPRLSGRASPSFRAETARATLPDNNRARGFDDRLVFSCFKQRHCYLLQCRGGAGFRAETEQRSTLQMKIIVIASQKGGVGKSTLTGHLSVQAEMSGDGPVVALDTDPQGSTVEWWKVRATEDVQFAQADVVNLRAQLQSLAAAGFKLAIIDTPPAVTEGIQAVINCADLVIIPTRPSPHDLRAIGRTLALLQNAGKRPYFVINGAASRARITAEAAIALSQHGTVCMPVLHQRTDFASSMTDGGTVQELDANSKSAGEVRELWDYIRGQLGLKGVKK